jgi:hypothetical protein
MTPWHVPDAQLRAWIDGTASMAASASVEQHLVSCDACRRAVAVAASPIVTTDLDAAWLGIRDVIESPRMNVLGRTLQRCGMSESDAVLLSSSPALTGAWLTGVALVALFTAFATTASPGRGLAIFLVLAPLLPVAGVAAAYGTEADATHELTLAAPYSKLRLLLLRTGAVVLTCVPLMMLAAVPLKGPWWLAVAWLLPATAFVMVTLAATTFMPPIYAAAGIALGWVALTLPALVGRTPLRVLDEGLLAAYVAIAICSTLVFAWRSRHLATDWSIG